MTKEFRFVGSEADYGDVRLDRLGQRFYAPIEDVYRPGGVPALETIEFDQIVSPSTVAALEFPNMRVTGPAELLEFEGLTPAPAAAMAELRAAWSALAARRAEFKESTNG